jgi:hypothetical protein
MVPMDDLQSNIYSLALGDARHELEGLRAELGLALGEARHELEGLRAEFERIAKRKAQLEAFIANAEPLVPVNVATLEFPKQELPPFVLPAKEPNAPIWKSITLAINGKGESFSVKDALAALERIGRPVESPNKFQIVRAVLKKKTDNFEQIAPGLFRMKKADREKEAISEEKAS